MLSPSELKQSFSLSSNENRYQQLPANLSWRVPTRASPGIGVVAFLARSEKAHWIKGLCRNKSAEGKGRKVRGQSQLRLRLRVYSARRAVREGDRKEPGVVG